VSIVVAATTMQHRHRASPAHARHRQQQHSSESAPCAAALLSWPSAAQATYDAYPTLCLSRPRPHSPPVSPSASLPELACALPSGPWSRLGHILVFNSYGNNGARSTFSSLSSLPMPPPVRCSHVLVVASPHPLPQCHCAC
jgi:hypothetical protein